MKLLAVVSVFLVAGALYYGLSMYQKFQIAKILIEHTNAFHQPSIEEGVRVLVVGDSTATGVGAKSKQQTVAAYLHDRVNASSLENYAVSGAVVADLNDQIEQADFSEYDYILVQIGGNNIIRFHNAKETAQELAKMLDELPTTDNLRVMSAGNVGATTFFPFFMNPFYTNRTLAFHKEFASVVEQAGGVYVNLYMPPSKDPFVQQPDLYLSADGLHPAGAGYALWFDSLAETL